MGALSFDMPDESENERKELNGRLALLADRTAEPTSLKPSIENIAGILRDKLRRESHEDFEMVIDGLKRCGLELPHKAPVYAAVTGLLSAGNAIFAQPLASRVTEAVVKSFTHTLREGRAAESKRALRYLVCLAGTRVVSPVSVAGYIQQLLDAALKEMAADVASNERRVHARGQFLADIALSVLPWAGPIFKRSASGELESISTTANKIFEAWQPTDWSIIASSPHLGQDMFGLLMKAIQKLEIGEWDVPKTLIPDFTSEFEDELVSGQNIELPALSIPAHSKRAKYAPPRHRLRLLNSQLESKTEKMEDEVPNTENGDANGKRVDTNGGTKVKDEVMVNGEETANNEDTFNPVEKFVKLSYVSDVLDNFSTSHRMAAERLLMMPMLANSNDEVVEGLFSEMCGLPVPAFTCVYYGILFVDLCKVKDSRLPVKLLAAVETMFQQSDELDPEAFDRLTTWFAFHLSNFGYRWNWADWVVYSDPGIEKEFPFRALFCRDVLKRCIDLSFYDHMASMADEMQAFLPKKPNDGTMDHVDNDVNMALLMIVTGSGKQPPPVVKAKLLELFPPSTKENEEEKEIENRKLNCQRLAALLRAILKAGYKTLSHFETVALRYIEILHELIAIDGPRTKRVICREVCAFWDTSPLRRLYALDKLSMNNVIDGQSILDTILSLKTGLDEDSQEEKTPEMLAKELSDSDTWEIVRLVLERATAREEGARLELSTASQFAAKATEGDAEAMEARLERAKSGTVKSVQVIKECLELVVKRMFEMSDILLTARNDTMNDEKKENEINSESSLPGFDGAPIWLWRSMGMVRECGRRHPRYMSEMMGDIKNFTQPFCERHAVLKRSLNILELLAGSDMLPQSH